MGGNCTGLKAKEKKMVENRGKYQSRINSN
jgi:hypothetical protein